MSINKSAALLMLFLMTYSIGASAALSSQGVLDQVITEFSTRATTWKTEVMNRASFLFWILTTISMVWTFGMLALRKADIGEFFAEFFRFIMFTGFFFWLLTNGPDFANSIMDSLRTIGGNATGKGKAISPSDIVDVGFMVWKQAIKNLSVWSPVDSVIGVILSIAILILLALISVNMMVLLISGWVLAYAGIFFLGFGGSQWTSDMAINYYKTILGVAAQLFTMVLLVGIGTDLLMSFYTQMDKGQLNFEQLGVMLVFCLALLMLVNKIPPLIGGIVSGGGLAAGGGIGSFGAGAAVGAAVTATAAAGVIGSTMAAGATNVGDGVKAIMAAIQAGQAENDNNSLSG